MTYPGAALQWVKRRGPTVHHGHLRSLFRKGLIKMFLPATSQVKTVTERTQLIVGDQILIPREVSDLKPDPDYSKTLDITTPAAARLMQQLVASVLYEDDDMFIINKPQGVAVQGGPSIDLSLDQVMPAALGYDFPEPPRYTWIMYM